MGASQRRQIGRLEDLERLWRPILASIAAISPGLWILWHRIPRRSYRGELAMLDEYLYGLIRRRRAEPNPPDDLLTRLVDKSLVQVETGQQAAWYRLLEPVRQYAAARLAESSQFDGYCGVAMAWP